jgi:hypothetical protein
MVSIRLTAPPTDYFDRGLALNLLQAGRECIAVMRRMRVGARHRDARSANIEADARQIARGLRRMIVSANGVSPGRARRASLATC